MSTKSRWLSMTAIIALLLVATVQPLFAQTQGPITSSVDRTDLTTDEMLTLSIAVTSAGRSQAQPQLPDLDGFNIVGQNSSTNISVVNGEMSTSMVYSYRLQPYRTGTLTIGPVQIDENSQTYATAPIVVEVRQGTGLPQQTSPALAPSLFSSPFQSEGQGMYVEATLDKLEPFVGEQLVYTFRLYEPMNTRRLPGLFSSQPSYEAPAMTGFWAEGEAEQSAYQVSNNGRIYTVTELRSNVFPTVPGEATIEPARLTMPGSLFQSGGKLATDPLHINVKALPAGAPANFGGAVGQYEIRAALDSVQSKVDEPITLRVTLSANGNVSTAADPVWPQMDGWRAFDAESDVHTSVVDGRVVGTRSYDWLLVPTQAGEQTIPAIEYSYFDPADEQYHTISTQPVRVSIAPGTGSAGSTYSTTESDAITEPAEEAKVLNLKDDAAALTLPTRTLPEQPWYWFLWTVPLMGLVGSYSWQRRQSYLQRNAVRLRSSRAHKEAQTDLREIERSDASPAHQDGAIHQVLSGYLQAKLNRPISGMTSRDLVRELQSRGVPVDTAEKMAGCYQASEQSQFSPGDIGQTQTRANIERAAAAISALELTLSRGEIVS